jgi:hypothetical protein
MSRERAPLTERGGSARYECVRVVSEERGATE